MAPVAAAHPYGRARPELLAPDQFAEALHRDRAAGGACATEPEVIRAIMIEDSLYLLHGLLEEPAHTKVGVIGAICH